MPQVTSQDGTRIAYDEYGKGPVVILVTGALGFRSPGMMRYLAARLASHFTVYDYDRRGRGESGDTPPYTVQREVEDIDALIDAAGGSAYLYGLSSGAVLALDAANALPQKVKKLALYEPPLILDDSRPPIPVDYVTQLNAAIAAGQRGEAVEIFMTQALLIPREFVAMMRNAPMVQVPDSEAQPPAWEDMEKAAHTLAYDGIIVKEVAKGSPLLPGQWSKITAPTLVITGETSEKFFHDGAQAIVARLSNAKHRVLEGQNHAVSPAALAPVLVEFFS